LRALVVDDNQDAAEMLSEALAMKGYETRVAHDGPAALRICEQFRPAIALLDIGLPVMDGYELAGRLRKISGMKQLRLIAVTGYGQEADRQRSRAAGFDQRLVKPIDLEALGSALALASTT
jgi:CheY-like chemotaxis protein